MTYLELNVDLQHHSPTLTRAATKVQIVLSHSIITCGSAMAALGAQTTLLDVAIPPSILFMTTAKCLVAGRFLLCLPVLANSHSPHVPSLCRSHSFRSAMVNNLQSFRAHLILLMMLMLNYQAPRGPVFAIGQRTDKQVCSGWTGLCLTLAHIIGIYRSR